MFLLPATPSPTVVHCVMVNVRTSGLSCQGRLPSPLQFSMKMISDCKDFGTTGQRRPNATSLKKNEFHLINTAAVHCVLMTV